MDEILSSPPSPGMRKRPAPDDHSPTKKPLNLKGTQFMVPTPPDTEESSPLAENGQDRAVSPAPSSSALSSISEAFTNPVASADTLGDSSSNAPAAKTASGQPPAKRRKLSPTEKLEQARLKEAKAAEKAELKAKKDEEKRIKDEEKRVKDEEKRVKDAVKDEEKRQKAEEREEKKREKELEEERKKQGKLKKERAQMRLGAFFQKPATPAKSPAPNGESDEAIVGARRRSLSLETFDSVADQIRAASPVKGTPPPVSALTPGKAAGSFYHKYFLPFDIPSHTVLATPRWTDRSLEDAEQAQTAFDSAIMDPSLQEKYDLGLVSSYASVVDLFAAQRGTSRGLTVPTVRELVDRIQGHTSERPIGLTQDRPSEDPMTALQSIPKRYLQFQEDVRPAYYGTYTNRRTSRSARHLSRNPFARERTDTNYDYDSEAEWEEPGEGEDLMGDEDDEVESNGDADEMDGFLDDENDELKNKRKMITGDLAPISTGLCWENEAGRIIQSIERDDTASEMKGMRMGVLIPGFTGTTIDPFSTAYWEPEIMPPPAVPVGQPAKLLFGLGSQSSCSRPPLKERNGSGNIPPIGLVGAAQGEKGPINSVAATALQGEKRGRKPAPKTLSKEDMDEFKDAVVGSQLGKLELCKGLKARFPKIPNDVIKDTLGAHFAQVGTKREDKVWRYVDVD